jgi:hypothetical protein
VFYKKSAKERGTESLGIVKKMLAIINKRYILWIYVDKNLSRRENNVI